MRVQIPQNDRRATLISGTQSTKHEAQYGRRLTQKMSKFNKRAARTAARSPFATGAASSGVTYEGAPGYARDAKTELFLLAVTNMVGEQTFYETGRDRDSRYAELVREVAVDDLTWLTGFLGWLRSEANMRSASLVGAAEAVKARLDAKRDGGSRQLVASVLQRADEPGELLAYWHSRYGRAEPKPVKRGIADAVIRLYDEFAMLKYDTVSSGYRFADVIERVHVTGEHPEVKGTWKGELYEYAIDRRHNRDNPVPETLAMIRANAELRARAAQDPRALLDAGVVRAAGMTWEDALSLAGGKVSRRDLWAALIPSMGYMALLRNLRNFDEAGVDDDVAGTVAERLADPARVARSRQLPMRFLAAYRAAPSLRWSHPLDKALSASVASIPALRGRTLILVDTSSSMNSTFSKDGTVKRWDAAALFALALGARCDHADVVSFSSTAKFLGQQHGAHTRQFSLVRGESLLRSLDRWQNGGWFLGGGTATAAAVRQHYRDSFHTRVVILTDEQAAHDGPEVSLSLPGQVPLYTWNLAGYRYGHGPSGSGNRHVFGGLTDTAFRMVPWLESGRDATWPWGAS